MGFHSYTNKNENINLDIMALFCKKSAKERNIYRLGGF